MEITTYFSALEKRFGFDNTNTLRNSVVGIAGLGGLGSSIGCMLARAGVGKLVVADFDTVELCNIHRQCYPISSIGKNKTDAFEEEILRINPWCKVEKHTVKLNPSNLDVFDNCHILCEAVDSIDIKKMLMENIHIPIVSGNGMAGIGKANDITTKRIGKNIIMCGDFSTDVSDDVPLVSSRVTICAGHQANAVIRILLGLEP